MNVGHCFWGRHVCVAAANVVTLVMGFSLAFLHTLAQCGAPTHLPSKNALPLFKLS